MIFVLQYSLTYSRTVNFFFVFKYELLYVVVRAEFINVPALFLSNIKRTATPLICLFEKSDHVFMFDALRIMHYQYGASQKCLPVPMKRAHDINLLTKPLHNTILLYTVYCTSVHMYYDYCFLYEQICYILIGQIIYIQYVPYVMNRPYEIMCQILESNPGPLLKQFRAL